MKKYFDTTDYDKLIHFQFPKVLMYGDKYSELSNDAKLLYMVCFDLTRISMENHGRRDRNGNRQNWKDDNGFFIKLSLEKIQQVMKCGKTKAVKLKKDLEKYSLLKQKRVGVQRANLIYVMQLDYNEDDIYNVNDIEDDLLSDEDVEPDKPTVSSEVQKMNLKKFENGTSRSSENEPQEVQKVNPINKELNKNKINKNKYNLSITESEIQKLNIPLQIQKQLIIKIDRLIDDNINPLDIELLYNANKDKLNKYQFAQILATVLESTKGKIINIKGLIQKSIYNYLNNNENALYESDYFNYEFGNISDTEPESMKVFREFLEG